MRFWRLKHNYILIDDVLKFIKSSKITFLTKLDTQKTNKKFVFGSDHSVRPLLSREIVKKETTLDELDFSFFIIMRFVLRFYFRFLDD